MEMQFEGSGGENVPGLQKWRITMLCKEIAEGIKEVISGQKETRQRFGVMTCTLKSTGETVEAIVLVKETDERTDFLPIAIMPRDKDLCELLIPPDDTIVKRAGDGVQFGGSDKADKKPRDNGVVIPFPVKKPGPFDIN